MVRNIDIALLRAFTAAAEQRSMTAASQILHLTQGAISQQVARLEALVGAPLFFRERRGLRLTPLGERLLDKAGRLLALNDEIWTDIQGGAINGIARFGVPYDLVGTLIAPALKAFAQECPQVELSLVCEASETLARNVARGELDFGVLEEPAANAKGECLAVDRLVWAGTRGGVAHTKNPLPVSLVAETCAFKPAVLSALEQQGREWRTVFENGTLDATMATVRADLAISAWLSSTVPADLEILGPAAGLPDLPAFAITLHLPDRPLSPAARELVRHIRHAMTRPHQGT
ncbi:DNA-binding transcriptional LysR family regulator [Mesorhizobium soli]|uniref:LysR family transcriptional regulator n=1 Tax=Pseudaminobacter soli (ex Li et al. 2025) TaxID=1295366 RepID=UPI0024758610|nr:LysR substrate-binding domain-containing protein [Mesorhizobium soli]MDH6230256.1 DNA-binding transcriptional LysR family regulator [Mesorhizobium soli]